MTTPTASNIDGYIKLDGSFAYCDDDADKKCVDASQVCSSYNGRMACGNWWGSGYWTGWWNWSYYYGFFGDNLIFLYSEVEAPDEYLCGYPRSCSLYTGSYGDLWWFGLLGSQYCAEDFGDCNYPRIKNCKTSRCVQGSYSNYYYGSYWGICDYINGKDRAERCCKKPANFTCEEGECDYDYEIVKKTYSIEYELVKPSYFCNDPPPNPESSCDFFQFNVTTVPEKCYQKLNYCSPKNKCPQISSDEKGNVKEYYWCNPDDTKPAKGYEEISDEPYQVIWDFPPKDCDEKCSRCIPCGEDDCNFAWYNNYNWGWGYWSFFNSIGSDCCDSGIFAGQYTRPQICPSTTTDDGSGNPWWCTGTDCVQMAEGEETEGFTGPFASRTSCVSECNDDTNKCVPPDSTITSGLCCDKKFMEKLEEALQTDNCNEQVERKSQQIKETICVGKNCQDSVVFNYTKEICGYKPKFAEVEKTVHTRSYKLYEYAPEIPKQNFADYIQCGGLICDQDAYAKCRADFAAEWGSNDCPTGSKRLLEKQTVQFKEQEIVGTTTVSVVAVFCKVTTKPCAPSESEE
jgi:hypothetical protein